MKIYFKILSCGKQGNGTTILMFAEDRNYLFNSGEGTQRLLNENGIKIPRISDVFLTRTNWKCIGGLPGLIITHSEAEASASLSIHGDRSLLHAMCSMRHFLPKLNCGISCVDVYKDKILTTKTSSVTAVTMSTANKYYQNQGDEATRDTSKHEEIIRKMFGETKESFDTSKRNKIKDSEREEKNNKRRREMLIDKFNPGTEKSTEFSDKNTAVNSSAHPISYIIKSSDTRGRFYPEKAMELGVKKKSDFGVLTRGGTVINEHGVEIFPHQCMDKEKKGSVVLIIDCPGVEYIEQLIQNDNFKAYLDVSSQNYQRASLIIHILGENVLETERYRLWAKKFGSETQHVISANRFCSDNSTNYSSVFLQNILNKLDSDIYRADQNHKDPESFPKEWELGESFKPARAGIIYNIEPSFSIDEGNCIEKIEMVSSKVLECPSEPLEIFLEELKDVKGQIEEHKKKSHLDNSSSDDILVCTLGTGAASPSRVRNVSANLVYRKDITVLFDCGEGSYGQMFRRFNLSKDISLGEVLENLRLIVISHAHADHHLGLVNIINHRRLHFENSGSAASDIYIVGPTGVIQWIKDYSQVEKILDPNVTLVDSARLDYKSLAFEDEILNMIEILGLKKISTIPVYHCHNSRAVTIAYIDNLKVAYSGDCRPSENLAIEASDADILIHEATFEDSNFGIKEAKAKRHCTSNEVLGLVKKMQCKNVILTHFSQRYPIIPPIIHDLNTTDYTNYLNNPYVERQAAIILATDLMSIKLSQMWRFPYYYDVLKHLWAVYSSRHDYENQSDSKM